MIRLVSRVALVLFAISAATACTSEDEPEPATKAATGPAQPRCADVFRPGEIIEPDAARDGCLDDDGGVQYPTSVPCGDGRVLWAVEAATGAPAGWGFSGEEYQENGGATIDKKYNKAYEKCAD